ncbi:MAG: hypothetical protein AAF721_40990 [Myxococcota bacterium]
MADDGKDVLARYRAAKSPGPDDTRAAWARMQAQLDAGVTAAPESDPDFEANRAGPRWVAFGAAALAIAAVVALAFTVDLSGVVQSQRSGGHDEIEAPYVGEHESADGYASAAEREAAERRRRRARPPTEAVPEIDATPPAPEPPALPEEAAPLEPTPQPKRRPPKRPSTDAPKPSTDATIAAEMALLKSAQQAIAGGNPSRALEKLRQHAKTFPNSMMDEERELARVRALCALGKETAAAKAARKFRRNYKGSHLSKRLDSTCVGPAE